MVALIQSEKDWDQVQWMQGRLSSLNASVNNVRLTWRRIARPYVQMDARVERRLDEQVRRYRDSAMRERKLAEEEAAMTTPSAQEHGDTEGPGERARRLERELTKGILTLHLSWRDSDTQ